MKIVIFGAGLTGFELASRFVAEKKDVVVIDSNLDTLKMVGNHLDCITIHNDGNNIQNLLSAGLHNTEYFFALTNYDETNILACRIARSHNMAIKTIAGVKNDDYSSLPDSQLALLGIDYIVNAKNETARGVIESVEHGAIGNAIHFGKLHFELREMLISHKSRLCGEAVQNLRKTLSWDFLACVVFRGNGYFIPTGQTVLQESDIVYFFGHEDELDAMFAAEGIVNQDLKKIIIFGASDVGILIANYLSAKTKRGTVRKWFSKRENIILIDSDLKKCELAAASLKNAFVVHGNITDETIEQFSFKKYDVFLSVSDNYELNIISACYAKNMGTKRTLAVVAKNEYLKMASKMNIDTVISIKNCAVDKLMRTINSESVQAIHSLFSGEIEVAELTTSPKSRLCGKKVKDLKLPNNLLILFIQQDDKGMLVTGNSEIHAGDIVGCLGARQAIAEMQEMLK